MKSFCGLLLVVLLSISSNCESVVRKKRFFNTLWPSDDIKNDAKTGIIYSQLPPEYLYLLPGVNSHKLVQRRAGVQPQSQAPQAQPARFVRPTRMAIPQQPVQQQQRPHQIMNFKSQATNIQAQQQQGPKIIMKPIAPTSNVNPSFMLKTREQSLPDIHKNQRFVQPKPVLRANQKLVQPFPAQQHLPIKKAFETSPVIVPSSPLLSIKTAAISDFYYTKEFQDLLKEFNIKVEVQKLPSIDDVMSILGTENAEETLSSIRDVAKSREGMELIKSYLDQNTDREDGEFYNYDDDVGAGEIQVDGSEDNRSYQAPQYEVRPINSAPPANPPYITNSNNPSINSISVKPSTPLPSRPFTTGTLTGTANSWWRPTSWFSSAPSTKVDSLKKDSEILKNVVNIPTSGSVWENIQYLGKFLTPTSDESVPIKKVTSDPRSFIVQQPSFSSINQESKYLPTVRMTEAQFQEMVKTLRLTPMNGQNVATRPVFVNQQASAVNLPQVSGVNLQKAVPSALNIQPTKSTNSSQLHGIPPVKKQEKTTNTHEISLANVQPSFKSDPNFQNRFQAPINVQSAGTGIPLPSTLNQFENRRNFISASEPQRAAPYDFIATGRIHKANPDEVLKKSRSLVEAIEGEKQKVL